MRPTEHDARVRAVVTTPHGRADLLAVKGERATVRLLSPRRVLRLPVAEVELDAASIRRLPRVPDNGRPLPRSSLALLSAVVAEFNRTGHEVPLDVACRLSGLSANRKACKRACRRLRHWGFLAWGIDRDTLVPLVSLMRPGGAS